MKKQKTLKKCRSASNKTKESKVRKLKRIAGLRKTKRKIIRIKKPSSKRTWKFLGLFGK